MGEIDPEFAREAPYTKWGYGYFTPNPGLSTPRTRGRQVVATGRAGIAAYDQGADLGRRDEVSREEADKIAERLKGLGYLE